MSLEGLVQPRSHPDPSGRAPSARRRRVLVIVAICGGLLVVALAAVVRVLLDVTPYLAEREANAHVTLVATGHFDEAARHGGKYPAYAIAARPDTLISSARVTSTTLRSGKASATVQYRLDGATATQTITLVKRPGVLPHWAIDHGLTGKAIVVVNTPKALLTQPTVAVGGADVSAFMTPGAATFTLFPGHYKVSAHSSGELLTAAPQSVVTSPPSHAGANATLTFQLTTAAQQAVKAKVQDWLTTNCFATKRTGECGLGEFDGLLASDDGIVPYYGELAVTLTNVDWPGIVAAGDGSFGNGADAGQMKSDWKKPGGEPHTDRSAYNVFGTWSVVDGRVVLTRAYATAHTEHREPGRAQ